MTTRLVAKADTAAAELERRRFARRAPGRPPGASCLDVLGLQRTAGNRATGRLLASLQPPPAARVLQRAIIPVTGPGGLPGAIDTANLGGSKAQIDRMWNGGRRQAMADLLRGLQAAPQDAHHPNNLALQAHITEYFARQRSADPMAGNSGWWAQTVFDRANQPADQTGITAPPGMGEQLPAHPTALQTHALSVRSWQIGDIVDGLSWSTLGHHLQGRLTPQNYVDLGHGILGLRDLRFNTNLQATTLDPAKEQIARASCVRVSQEIRVGLAALPTTPGVSYRAATAAPDVYGTAIDVSDLLKDQAFWSTAGLRQSHTSHNFGDEGTIQVPKVYFIVNGSTGVFLPRYTNKEVGVREILYRDQTIFRVAKITNYAHRTFFVWVDEVDPATLPPHPVTKNPWSGAVNP